MAVLVRARFCLGFSASVQEIAMCSVIISWILRRFRSRSSGGFTPVCSNDASGDASRGFRPSKVYSCQRPGTERFTPVNALVLSRRVFGVRRVVRRRLRISVMFPESINGELVSSPNCL